MDAYQFVQFVFTIIGSFFISVALISMLIAMYYLHKRVKILEWSLMQILIILRENVDFNERVSNIIIQAGLVDINETKPTLN